MATALLCFQYGSISLAYDPPTFDSKVFSTDGIFWSDSEKKSLLEALTSLAVNFPTSQQVDSDLQEKALGLALSIDPLHYSSRRAHEALVAGNTPEKTTYFDSLSAISEALWRTSSSLLSTPAEPEEIRLAPYLMEISLLIHPDPPADRMESFGLRTRGGNLGWNRFLDLDANANPSSRRAQFLRLEAGDLLTNTLNTPPVNQLDPFAPMNKGPDGDTMTKPDPDTNPTGSPDPDRTMRPNPNNYFQPVRVRMPAIRTILEGTSLRTLSEKDEYPVLGELELQLRRPFSENEIEKIASLGNDPDEYPSLPILKDFRGMDLENLEISNSVARELNIEWPGKIIGIVSFREDEMVRGPRRPKSTSAWLPTLTALRVALTNAELNPAFLLSGSIDTQGEPAKIRSKIEDFIEVIPEEGVDYLLAPESALDDVVRFLQIEENLEVLFQREWISYSDAPAAVRSLTSETDPALLEAGKTFEEIAKVAERMPLVELARNAKVQERLEEILETYPRHFSARAMLEFGTRPVPEDVKLKAGATKIAKLVEPFLKIEGERRRFNNFGGFTEVEVDIDQLNQLRAIIDDRVTAHSRMRLNLPSELIDLHSDAEEVLEKTEAYLDLTNLTTSLASQKLRELRSAIEVWKASYDEMFEEP